MPVPPYGHAVVQSIPGKIGLGLLDVLQALEAFIAHKLIDQSSEPAGEKEKHVVQREQPRESPGSVDHRDMTQAMPAHRRDRMEEMVVGGNGNDRCRHHVLDRLIRHRAPGDTPHHVLLREYTGGLPWESVTTATRLPACAMLFTASLTLAVRATSTGFGPM